MQNILIYLFHRMKKNSLKEKKLSLKNKKFPFKENFPARWGVLFLTIWVFTYHKTIGLMCS